MIPGTGLIASQARRATGRTMPDVIALGVLLVDFVAADAGVSLAEARAFEKHPGGAPANVAVGLARLGVSSGFIGMVGDDAFGHFLARTLADEGVDVSALRFTTEARTALAFVSLRADGERDFTFYRHPAADALLRPEDVETSADLIRSARIFHFGALSLIAEPSRSATLRAAEIARAAGLFISFDPNLRLNLWPSADAAREGILLGWPLADVVKVSEEELAFITNEDLTGLNKPRLLVVTRGRDGCRFITRDIAGDVPGFAVEAVDTTGAGDAFMAGLLKGLLENPGVLNDEGAARDDRAHAGDDHARVLNAICRYANACGALNVTKRGAISGMAREAEVEELMLAADDIGFIG